MSASISPSSSSVNSQRTIPRASGVSNGRLHDHSAEERSPEPEREQAPKSVAVVGKGAGSQGFGQPGSSDALFNNGSDAGSGGNRRPTSKIEPPYSPEKPRTAQIDLLA